MTAAQALLVSEDYAQAQVWAERAVAAGDAKSAVRLAIAQEKAGDPKAAALSVDAALQREPPQTLQKELWAIAARLDESHGPFKWSVKKPPPDPEMTKWDEMEKRILGRWKYGKSQVYELKVEPWGALIFAEDTLKVSLTRVSMLRWRGDVGMVEGMYLVLEYEPASDTIETEFIPPEH